MLQFFSTISVLSVTSFVIEAALFGAVYRALETLAKTKITGTVFAIKKQAKTALDVFPWAKSLA